MGRPPERERNPHQHGWPGPLQGQHLDRTVLAHCQAGIRLYQSDRLCRGAASGDKRLHRVLQLRTPTSERRRSPSGPKLRINRVKIWTIMEKELILWWKKTKTLTCQGRGKEEELASAASPFVLKIIEV